jgi:hypothetical protein
MLYSLELRRINYAHCLNQRTHHVSLLDIVGRYGRTVRSCYVCGMFERPGQKML